MAQRGGAGRNERLGHKIPRLRHERPKCNRRACRSGADGRNRGAGPNALWRGTGRTGCRQGGRRQRGHESGAAGARKILRVLVGQRRHSCLHQTLPFSCWNVDDPNRPKLLTVEAKDRNYQSCMRIARRVVRGALADRTGGATHYHAKGVFPPWARGRMYSAEIGRHQFYAGIE